jgi:4-oxalocrotonate tautomerase
MPFVEIYVSERRSPGERRLLADAVHRALVRCVDVPEADRFQVIHRQPAADLLFDPAYLGIERSEGFVAVKITLRRGRLLEKKRALYRAIADEAHAALGLRREDVLVVLHENDAADWSFGNGVAQYASP